MTDQIQSKVYAAVAVWLAADAATSPLWRTLLAAMVFLLSGLFGLPALRAFQKADTTMDSVRIDRASGMVRGGIFRVTRNTVRPHSSLGYKPPAPPLCAALLIQT